jgi:hypothetical protein
VEVAEPHGCFGPGDSDAFKAAVERFFLVNYGRPGSSNWPLPVVQALEIVESDDDWSIPSSAILTHKHRSHSASIARDG